MWIMIVIWNARAVFRRAVEAGRRRRLDARLRRLRRRWQAVRHRRQPPEPAAPSVIK